MIDIHTHILPKVDDGAKNTETSLEMGKIAQTEGIKHLFATPHYIENEGYNTKKENKAILDDLRSKFKDEFINVELMLGNEVFITPNIINLLKEEKISTLNDSRYLLIELPMLEIPMYLGDVIYELKLKNIIPIIAHPERYVQIRENPNKLIKFIELGALCQMNIGALTGIYGDEVRNTAEILIEHNMIHFVGTDAHSKTIRAPKTVEAIEELRNIISDDDIKRLIHTNPMNIIEDKEMEYTDPIRYEGKKGIGKIIKRIFKKSR